MMKRAVILLALVLTVPAYGDPPAGDGSTGPVPMNTTLLDVATRNLKVAQAEFDAFVEAKRKEFNESQVYLAARKLVDDAFTELETLQSPLREALKASNPRYAQALQDIGPAREKLAEAIASKKSDDIAFRRSELQYQQGIITKAEAPVFAKSSTVQDAVRKLDAAKETLASMQKRFADTLQADQDYVALSKALNNAKSRLALARSKAQ
jgi:hypothetical protein